jgi:flavin-binding protein dodecin
MAQKVIDVVGVSKESFAKAAANAVEEAAKTVRGMKWARVSEFEMELEGRKITGRPPFAGCFRAGLGAIGV